LYWFKTKELDDLIQVINKEMGVLLMTKNCSTGITPHKKGIAYAEKAQ